MAHFTWAIQGHTLALSTTGQGTVSKTYCVYILASQRNGTLYIGVTGDLARRAAEHRDGRIKGFTQKYGVKTLVWYDTFSHIDEAIHFETRLKKYTRARKLELIESVNPQWNDLAPGLWLWMARAGRAMTPNFNAHNCHGPLHVGLPTLPKVHLCENTLLATKNACRFSGL